LDRREILRFAQNDKHFFPNLGKGEHLRCDFDLIDFDAIDSMSNFDVVWDRAARSADGTPARAALKFEI